MYTEGATGGRAAWQAERLRIAAATGDARGDGVSLKQELARTAATRRYPSPSLPYLLTTLIWFCSGSTETHFLFGCQSEH